MAYKHKTVPIEQYEEAQNVIMLLIASAHQKEAAEIAIKRALRADIISVSQELTEEEDGKKVQTKVSVVEWKGGKK